LSGFRRRDVFVQRAKDEVGIVIDADDPRTAVEIARKLVGAMACLFDGVEIADAPIECKRRLMLLTKLETCIAYKIDGTEFMIR
jgi:hypothetical protein